MTAPVPEPPCDMLTCGAISPILVISVAIALARDCRVRAETATGARCMDSSRFRAVTTISSSARAVGGAPAFCAGAAALKPAMMAADRAEVRNGVLWNQGGRFIN